MLNDFAVALSFLTIFRLPWIFPPEVKSENLAGSLTFFPLVGVLLGACWLAIAYFLSRWVPPILLAVMLTAVMALLTRALHLDGLADLVDGVGGGYTPARRLEIMKDSRTGAFGALALAFAVFLKAAALHNLILQRCWPPLLVIPMLSRLAMVLCSYKSIYARSEGGLGKPFLDHLTSREVLAASLFSVILSIILSRALGMLYFGMMLVIVVSSRRLSRRLLGGITGDVLGAVNEITEVVLLILAATASKNAW